MNYVTQGRNGLVLYQTHAFSPHGVFSFSNRLLAPPWGPPGLLRDLSTPRELVPAGFYSPATWQKYKIFQIYEIFSFIQLHPHS